MSPTSDYYLDDTEEDARSVCSVSGCGGVSLPDRSRCPVHATAAERVEFFDMVSEGLIDLRGCDVPSGLLAQALDALPVVSGRKEVANGRFRRASFGYHPAFDEIAFSRADFSSVVFARGASFDAAIFDLVYFDGCAFNGPASFERAFFQGSASFASSRFSDTASLRGARFFGQCDFDRARFEGEASFVRADLRTAANFPSVNFLESADFAGAHFAGWVVFTNSSFGRSSRFATAEFEDGVRFDGCNFGEWLDFSRAVLGREAGFEDAVFGPETRLVGVRVGDVSFAGAAFGVGTRIEIAAEGAVTLRGCTLQDIGEARVAAGVVDLRDVVVAGGGALRTGSARILLEGARFADPTTVSGAANDASDTELGSVESLRGTDAGNLVLSDIDLSACRFRGAHHLDQLRIEGRSRFAESSYGLRFKGVWPFARYRTRRQQIAEELLWRQGIKPGGQQSRDGAGNIEAESRARAQPDEVIPYLRMRRDRVEARERVTLTDEAVQAAFEQASRLVPARMVARRAFELLEEAAIMERQRDNAEPGELQALRDEIEVVRVEKEAAIEAQQFEEAASFRDRERLLTAELRTLMRDWLLTPHRASFESQPEIGSLEIARAAGLDVGDRVLEESLPPTEEIRASDVAEIYRLLRKGREDNRDEPGAADFYYGEMEMRRLGAPRSSPERWLLDAYWVLGGYALRPSRAFAFFVIAVAIAIPIAREWAFLHGHSWDRASVFVVGTALLRGPSASLTLPGEVIQLCLRVVGPVLIALAILGVRGRVRR